MKTPIWLFSAWEWLKKYWRWLLLPVGALLWLAGRWSSAKVPAVVSPELVQSEAAKTAINKEADTAAQQAQVAAAAKLSAIAAQQDAAAAADTQAQLQAAASAQGDSQKVNDLLHQVGKGMLR